MPPSHDLLVHCATIVTVDVERRILDNAWIAVSGDRIAAIGTGEPPAAKNTIDRRGLIALPGLIDAHSHAGHGLVRGAGGGDGALWFRICEDIYAGPATASFWRAEAQLALLERLMGGVTTAVSLLGGGADIYRTDTPEAGDAHAAATRASGLRTVMAVGPGRLPFPRHFGPDQRPVSFEEQMAVSEELTERHDDVLAKGTGVALILPVYTSDHMQDDETAIRAMARSIREMQSRTGALFTQDGHRTDTIALAAELGLLSSHAALSHSIDLSSADFEALAATGAAIVHNPSAIMSVLGRCPVPELIDAGITVCLGSDAGAPDRGFDMFRHMAQAMHYHRRHFRDAGILPEGKVLEMCTIDAARALGLETEIGSLEVGKKADIVLLDGRRAHLWPPVMPLNRITHFANAADVSTVIVNGRMLLDDRKPLLVSPDEVLAEAEAEANRVFAVSGHTDARREHAQTWGNYRRQSSGYAPSGSKQ